jgi:ParB family chromosome partitioning protein
MDKVTLGPEIKNISLEDLLINLGQVRTTDAGKDIHELAQSIKQLGQLEPIVVCPSEEEEGKFEIIAGQRRFLAHKEIGAKTISAVVIDKPLDEIDAKTLSLTENWHRLGLSRKDEMNACLLLWRRYKNVNLIVEETRLPASKVRQYLKYETLIKPLKRLVDKGDVDLDAAVRGQLAASVKGETDEEEAIAASRELTSMSGPQRKKVVKDRKTNPDKPVDEIVEEAKSGGKVTQVIVTLGPQQHQALQSYAKAEETNQDDAAAFLIEDGLVTKGFLEKDDES